MIRSFRYLGLDSGVYWQAGTWLAAAEIAFRLNPRHPPFYNAFFPTSSFISGVTVKRHSSRQRNFGTPARHLRDMGWRAAAYGHLGQIEEAQRCGELFLQSLSSLWRGDPTAGPDEYVDWIMDSRTCDGRRTWSACARACASPGCRPERFLSQG